MCFKISTRARKPTQTKVWRVMMAIGPDIWSGPVYQNNVLWVIGKWYGMKNLITNGRHQNVWEPSRHGKISRCGMYVFLTFKAAKEQAASWRRDSHAVFECQVSARDFLVRSRASVAKATYRRVKLVKQVTPLSG